MFSCSIQCHFLRSSWCVLQVYNYTHVSLLENYAVHVYLCSNSSAGDDKLSDAEQKILGAKVTRLNFSELYQHLNAASILQQMVDRQVILLAKKVDAEAYSHKFAQNTVAIEGMLSINIPSTFLLGLCDILEATDTSKQRSLAAKLRSGINH